MYMRKTTPTTHRRGLTPRVLELSRQLNGIEFKEPVGNEEAVGSPRAPSAYRASPPVSHDSGLRLRERLRVPVSEPGDLRGLELVEPARVDTTYREAAESSDYRQRRRGGDSIGSDISSVEQALEGRTITIPPFLATLGAGEGEPAERAPLLAETRKLAALQRRVHESWSEVGASMRAVRVLVVSNGGLPA
ncbi:hypothetical protein EC988_009032, partial [Linderina pennispora]